MSTRSTVVCVDTDEIHTHLYHEMHDDCHHFTIVDRRGSHSAIDIVLPDWMAGAFARLLAPLNGDVPADYVFRDPRLRREERIGD